MHVVGLARVAVEGVVQGLKLDPVQEEEHGANYDQVSTTVQCPMPTR